MSRQLTTTFSDCVLMIFSLLAALRLHQYSANWHLHLYNKTISIEDTPLFGIICFLTIALAAALGTIRFSFSSPPNKLVFAHRKVSWLVGVIGFSLLAANFNFAYKKAMIGWCHVLSIFVVFIALKILPHKLSKILVHVQQITSFVSVGIVCVANHNWQGEVGIHIVPIAVIIVGTDGKVLGLPAVDVFHYMLVCSVYLLSRALISI